MKLVVVYIARRLTDEEWADLYDSLANMFDDSKIKTLILDGCQEDKVEVHELGNFY